MERYLNESSRTAADKVFFENELSDVVDDALLQFVTDASLLDKHKKSIFYNRHPGGNYPVDSEDHYSKRADRNVIHGILGIATEAAEIADLLYKGDVGRAKLLDECGDILWYLALIFRTLGVSFEEVGDLNLAKLKARFPEKFDAEKAIKRTTDAEEQLVFEGH